MIAAAESSNIAPLLELKAISKRFVSKRDLATRIAGLFARGGREEFVHAVDGVDLAIAEGEVVGLAGESGCGKSTLGRLAVGLLAPTAGERFWRGERCADAGGAVAHARQLKMQMLFQDSYAALNPRLRVIDIVGEAPVAHGLIGSRQQIEYVGLQLNRVGLDPTLMRRFAHQFSAGQRTRIGIARALAVKPEFLVCDDPVARLDVSVQAQVLNLFMDLRAALDLAYLFISHDLEVICHLSDRILIMYLGRIVESGPARELLATPNHPYTQALLAASGTLGAKRLAAIPVKGEMPSPRSPPAGCQFHPRCPYVMPRCKEAAPPLEPIAPGRLAACYLNKTGA
jgi:peptide/nickel transport system ATP-binding protein